ncbi:S8 family serine peptidase [Erythrobacter sp. THAF29]|uniref:S8 family peptidase n=1 Tax=Erythrobacter sp. THAF29 TaxID=2587851 RepID=UPI00126819BF|nr:S8 family serine peptidase [Erythrobacter sp. THAF29]QFT77599.1 Subtilisin DY [Erythrobacter sp. THAF29]
MKSLSISTATFAVAISLASTAHAKEAAPHVVSEANENAQTIAFENVLEMPGIVNEPAKAATIEPAFSQALTADAYALEPTEGLLTLPAPVTAPADFASSDRVVTARSVSAHYGDIDAFYGDIVAFYGDIDAFWGDINPFYGDIDAFYGDISPFYGDIDAFWGDIDAFYGDIVAFDQTKLAAIGAFWNTNSQLIGSINNSWEIEQGKSQLLADYASVAVNLQVLTSNAIAEYGAAGFSQVKADEVFARHGINLLNAQSLGNLTDAERAAFFLDWHDTVMSYAGIDHVDHWMGTINWTPSITQIQGEGKQTVIGIVDGSFASDADLGNNVVYAGGGTTTVGGHGVGVASLIAGAHDGNGVMGIAPKVKIATYNPFDATNTATWDSVRQGVQRLIYKYVGGNETGYASIINLSLGQSGWALSQGMVDVLDTPSISAWHKETIYVIAAGNDGVTQTADLDWDFTKNANIILVGSVDPNGQISSFSNRPGNACLLDNGVCHAGNELYNRFVVAPGSLILVSDGQGGTTRMSGTSFSAPLVSGAVGLLHDRWPWLVRHQSETAEIIFRSAKDLGAPGVDPVYGHGLLDVAASQSPLDFNALQFYLYSNTASQQVVSATELLNGGVPAWWETNGVYFTAFENIGGTYRDFTIPMSTLQYGTSSNVLGHGWQRMQDFVSDRFANWLLSNGADSDGDGTLGVSQIRSNTGETRGQWTMRYDAIAPRFTQDGAMRPVHNAATLTTPNGQMSFTLGHGQGALALSGGEFGIMSDHDYATGGVNPVLGFASGEVFAGASYKLADATTLSFGYSKDREDYEDLEGASELDRTIQRQLGAREAEAITVGLEQQVAKGFTLGAQWTRLDEKDAILGSQTGVDALLGNGSVTDAVTLTASLDMGDGLSFDLSATGGATDVAGGQLLATSTRALSTAGQFSVNKRGVMGEKDVLRVSVGQPLNIERGELELTSEQVVDRVTGERGLVTQTIGITTKRRNTAEIVYATPVTETSEFGLVTRYISSGTEGDDESFMIGANFGLRF